MTQRRLREPVIAGLLLVAVLSAGAWALATSTDIRATDQRGIALTLPDNVGLWRGDEIRYCQTPDCQAIHRMSDLDDRATCPTCGGELAGGSLVEWKLLPGDTEILKKLYAHPVRDSLLVSIVLGGASRTSIHRPQICLVGDGREIVATRGMRVPLSDGSRLRVTVLDLLWRQRTGEGSWRANPSFYGYWFVGPHRETSSHYLRMAWMAWDQIVHGKIHRWAYVSVSGSRDQDNHAHLELAEAFLAELYPMLERNPLP